MRDAFGYSLDDYLLFGGYPGAARLVGDPERLVESAVGAYLLARSHRERFAVRWWREGNAEVDFVLSKGDALIAIEVKSGRVKNVGGLTEFLSRYPGAQPIVVGDANSSLERFLADEIPLFD